MINKEILKNIKITEESILTLFKEKNTIQEEDLINKSLIYNVEIIGQEFPDLFLSDEFIKTIKNIILERIRNLCKKKYIIEIKFKSNNDEAWLSCYSKLDLTDIGNVTDNEVVIRASRDKTILYYNDKEENDIIEISIKTEAKLNKDSFLNVDILDFTHTDYNYYNIYKIIFIIKPFTKLELTTDKNHKCFQSVDIEDPYTELYKYYGMKIFVNNKKLIKLCLFDKKDSSINLHKLKINNLLPINTGITIFASNNGEKDLLYLNLELPAFHSVDLDLKTMGDTTFYAYFVNHDRCIILDGNNVLYEYRK